jgi:hypothetical protein
MEENDRLTQESSQKFSSGAGLPLLQSVNITKSSFAEQLKKNILLAIC